MAVSLTGFTPYDTASGEYYFIVVTDSRNDVFELNENNNQREFIVNVKKTVSTDIVVMDVTMTAGTWTFGNDVSVSWKLRNNGSLEAEGYKCDTPYLSGDEKWDIEDMQIGEPTCSFVTLDPYSNNLDDKPYNIDNRIPLIAPGKYFGLVKSRSNIHDVTLENNVDATNSQETITVPVLQLDNMLTGVSMARDSANAYVIPAVPSDETLIVQLTSASTSDVHNLYIRYATPATTYQFDAFSALPLSADQEVIIQNTEQGDYYVLVENNGPSTSTVSLLANLARFELRRMEPAEASQNGNVTFHLSGTLFGQSLSAKLKYGDKELQPLSLFRISSTELYATFDFRMSVPGEAYDMILTDLESGASTSLTKAVLVKYGKAAKLSLSSQLPRALRPQETGIVSVSYQNIGGSDMMSPLLKISITGVGSVRFLDSDRTETGTNFFVMASPIDGPGGILRPRSSGRLVLEGNQNNPQPGRTNIVVQRILPDDTPHLYIDKKDEMRPVHVPTDAWDIVWDNFILATGTTMRSLNYRLSEMLNTMAIAKRRPKSVTVLVDFLVKICQGSLTGDSLLEVIDIQDTSAGLSDLVLAVQRTYSPVVTSRRYQGPFGFGWSSVIIESKLLTVSDAEIVILYRRQSKSFRVDPDNVNKFIANDNDEVIKDDRSVYYNVDNTVFVFDLDTLQLTEARSAGGLGSISVNHDELGRVKLLTHSEGSTLQFGYNQQNKIISAELQDKNGETSSVSYAYDAEVKYLTSVTKDGSTARYIYSSDGDLTEIRHPHGGYVVYGYNQEKLLSSVEGRLEDGSVVKKWSAMYDWNGRVFVTEYPQNTTTEYWHDENALVAMVNGEGLEPVSIQRSIKRSSMEVRYGEQLVYRSSIVDEELTVQLNMGATVKQTYGVNGEIKKFTDGNGNAIVVDYDDGLRVKNVTYPDSTQNILDYYPSGRVQSFTTRSGAVVTYQYDERGNLVQKDADGTTNLLSYNDQSLVTSSSNPVSTNEITYSSDAKPKSVVYQDGSSIQYAFNMLGHRTMMSTNTGLNVTYEYDKLHRLEGVWLRSPRNVKVLQMEYDDKGQIIRRNLGNGGYTTYKYHPQTNWLLELVNHHSNGTVSSYFEYQFDSRGRVKGLKTEQGTWKLRYDSNMQLTFWETPDGETVTVSYDSNKNRLSKERKGIKTSYEVNHLNQYVSYGASEQFKYDRNGNLVERTHKDGSRSKFEFSSENKLLSTETPQTRCRYIYDALGNLYQKNCSDSQTQYMVDPFGVHGGKRIAEVKNGGTTYYVHGLQFGLVARVNGSDPSNILYYEYDNQGSVVGIQEEDGQLKASYVYDPFGNILNMYESDSAFENDRLFLGQWGVKKQAEVEQSGFYMTEYRYYDSDHGRFVSPDPIELAGKGTNFYCYAENNPLLFRDPNGEFVPAVILAGAIIGAVTNAAITGVTSYMRDGSVNWASVAGATVSGAITGAGITLGASVAAGGMAITFGGGVLGGIAGYGTTQGISGQSFDPGRALGEGLWNGIAALIPTKMVGYKGWGSSRFGNIPSTSFLKTLLGKNKTGKAIWKTLMLGNLFGNIPNYFGGFGNLKNLLNAFLQWIMSRDPNDILGPDGYGDAGFLPVDFVLEYKIRFENDENATAPAQKVLVKYTFDEHLDMRTFRVGDFGFGNFSKEIDYNRAVLQDMVKPATGNDLLVRIRAGINIVTNEATWELQTVDANTGQQPDDPRIGFLPPNNGTSGQGYVTFQVKPKRDVISMDRIDAKAVIYFDQNEPIETPSIYNTIDNDIPEVNLTVMSEVVAETGSSVLRIGKMDASSGVRDIDLYVKDGDVIRPLLMDISEDVAVVPLSTGASYQILATAVDHVGNQLAVENAEVVELVFPQYESSSCQQLSNCSGNGNCSAFGFCQCDGGFYGATCSSDVPVPEPPILEASILAAVEDTNIPLYLNARPVNGKTDEVDMHITVSNFPVGFSFSKGQIQDQTLILQKNEFGTLHMMPHKHYASNITLELRATVSWSSEVSVRTGSLLVPIQPVADPPLLYTTDACYTAHTAVHSISLNISAALVDTDGSEKLGIVVKNVPASYTLGPHGAVVREPDGTYYVRDLSNIAISSSGNFTNFTLHVVATATENGNADVAEVVRTLSVTECIVEGGGTTETTTAPPDALPRDDSWKVIVGVVVPVAVVLAIILVTAVYCARKGGPERKAGNFELS